MAARYLTLVRTDMRLMLRDGFLFSIGILYLAFAVVLRLTLPALNRIAGESLGIDLQAFYPALTAFIVFFEGALPAGVITAFLLIEERDQQTLDALLVSPLPIGAFLAYRLISAYLLAFTLISAAYLIIGMLTLPLHLLAALSAVAALNGPLIALAVATAAGNKIEGFAMLKTVNLIGLPILIAWFTAPQWHWLFAPFPAYWTARAQWAADSGAAGGPLAVAAAISIGLLLLLFRRYRGTIAAG